MSEYIGRYRVLRPLGEGGMGRVLLAEVVGSGGFARQVVLKLVRDELDESLKTALLEEARVTATLVHRNIVPVLDLHETGAQRLVVLEYIDGMDLGQLLKKTPLVDWPLAAFIGGEVAAALDYAHRRQVIHRDVSPANILLSFEGEVKLGDFGVAKVVGGPHRRHVGPTQGLKGKLGYMAPEQMAQQPVDARADIYSLGVVMYEMLTGKNPMRAGPRQPPPLPPSVPKELAEIVMRAVSRARDERFASAADLREAILHVPGQPADPPRRLADFLGEVRPRSAGGVEEALLEAVLGGGKAPTAMARKSGGGRWRWPAAALLALLAGGTALGFIWKQHVRAAAKDAAAAARPGGKRAAKVPPSGAPSLSPARNATGSAPLPAAKQPSATDQAAETKLPADTDRPTDTDQPAQAEEPPAAPEPMAIAPAPVTRHKRRQRGALSVNAIPWANVFIDGHAAGHTPRLHLPLDAGRHHLRLVTQAGEARTRTIDIAPDKETTLTIVFSEP